MWWAFHWMKIQLSQHLERVYPLPSESSIVFNTVLSVLLPALHVVAERVSYDAEYKSKLTELKVLINNIKANEFACSQYRISQYQVCTSPLNILSNGEIQKEESRNYCPRQVTTFQVTTAAY